MRKSITGHLAMLVANSIWGFTTPITKIVLLVGSITFLSLTSVRLAGAAAVFWIASFFTRKEKVKVYDLFLLFMASFFGIICGQGAYMKGLSMTSPIDASIMTTTTPIFTLIISAIYLKEEITTLKIGGIIMGAFGATLLILYGKGQMNTGSVIGNCLCMLAQFGYSIYLVLFKGLIERFSPVTLMKWIFTFAFLCWIPFSYQAVININYPALTYRIYFYLAVIILGGTFFSYLLISVGQHSLRPSVVGMYNYIQPVVASCVAIFWGMDSFNLVKLIAVFLVFSGVFLVNKGKMKHYHAYSE